jgi:hypothetical protein
MRVGLIVMAFALCACASYGVADGDANYDALKAATDQCQAKGGHLQVKSGYDGRRLSDYACKSGEAK